MHECRSGTAVYDTIDLEGVNDMKREEELRRMFRRAAVTTGLLTVVAFPLSATAQTPANDPNATRTDMMNDNDDDGMDMGWIGLLGLAGLLGLRKRDNVDIRHTPTSRP